MARKIAVLSFWLLPTLLLSGCNLIEGIFTYNTSGNSTNISENNQFAATYFPLESCGDTLPEEPQAYPLEVYSVTLNNDIRDIERKRRNVEIIKSRFCPNASVGVYHEQDEIAQFISRDKASDFKELLESELGNDIIQLSSPQIIEVPPSQITLFTTKEEIGAAAGLAESQIEQLLSLEEFQTNDGYIRKVKAIVPTYLPSGFQVDEFKINEWGNYAITYKNRHNACFSIYDTGPRGDAPARHETIRAIYSRALGYYINLGYTQTHRLGGGGYGPDLYTGFDMIPINAQGRVVSIDPDGEGREDVEYILGFSSGFVASGEFNSEQECEQLSLQELVKVIQSLHALNPLSTTNQDIAEAALLTEEQVADLRQVQLRDQYPIIVPTYVPDGFSVKRIHSDNSANSYDSDLYGVSKLYHYILYYSNDYNVCFSLGIERTTWAGPDRYEIISAGSANSLIFGTANIEYTRYSNLQAGDSLSFIRSVRNRGGRFVFHSLSRTSSSDLECTNALSIEETIKVVESFDFLFSDHMDVNIRFIGDERYN